MIRKRAAGAGRPKWKPRNETHARKMVSTMVAFGHPYKTISALLDPPCGIDTMTAFFAEEIETGASLFKARAETTLGMMALGTEEVRRNGKVVQKAVPPDRTMLIFLLKTRYDYRDQPPKEQIGWEGLNLEDLSDAQLGQLVSRLTKAIGKRSGDGQGKPDDKPVVPVHRLPN